MNYLEIVLRGYFDDNKRQFLEKYFYREYKKAEKEKFFEASEFFSGCLKATKGLKNEINQQINKYKTHLHTELKNAETLEKIDFYKQELEGIIKGSHSITMPLHSQTTGRTRQIGLNEINQINLAIAKAYAKTNDVNSLIPQPIKTKADTEKYTAKHYLLAYLFECNAKGESYPIGNKKELERIGNERMGAGKGNRFYKVFNEVIKKDLNAENNLFEIGGEYWRKAVIELSKAPELVENYLQSKQL